MLEHQFFELLKRFEDGTCTSEEKKLIEQWLNSIEGSGFGFQSQEEKDRLRNRLHRSITEKTKKRTNIILKPVPSWLKIAASFLIIIAIVYALFFLKTDPKKILLTITSKDYLEKVILPDGSIIWLKPNSKLTYPKDFQIDNRDISFEGDALFEISKDSIHPFFIHMDNITTKVLGTSFNINTKGKETEVYVLTGKVEVSSNYTSEKVIIKPKEKATFNHGTKVLKKIYVPTEKPTMIMEGTEYDMNFSGISLFEITKRIEHKFNVKIKIEGSVGNCLITADLTDQSLYISLDMITEALNATYRIDKEVIIIYGTRCE